MAEKRKVIYKLERHKWPDEIAAEKQARRRKLAVVGSCLLFFAAGFFVSRATAGGAASAEASAEINKLKTVYHILNEKWYFGKDIDDLSTTLFEQAINGMATHGSDRHTRYMDMEDAQSFSTSLEGTFVGIGVQFYQNKAGRYVVADVYENSPAQKAGFERGDILLSVDGTDCGDLSQGEIKEVFSSGEEKSMNVLLERNGKQLTKQVTPSVVDNSVISYIEEDYGYIRLSSFAENSGKDMESALNKIADAGKKQLIFDLRGNGGGYLTAALDIAKCFLPKGTVVFQAEDRNGTRKEYTVEEDYHQVSFDTIVILMNENTASASEALISALDENLGDRVVLMGDTTYGKGTMQTSVPFSDGTSLKYTSAQWYSSKGNPINGVGIRPDVAVSLDEAKTTSMPIYKKDVQIKADSVDLIARPVQIYLRFLGYDVDRTDEYFSPASAAALREFQKDQGLEADGVIDNEVAQALADAASLYWNEHQEELDVQMKKAVEWINGK